MRQLKLGSRIGNGNRFGKHSAAFHLALVLSIVGSSSGIAQTTLPELPKLPSCPTPVAAVCQSLPIVYPFESRQETRERTTEKLISMLGLRTVGEKMLQETLPALPPAVAVDLPSFPTVITAAAEANQTACVEDKFNVIPALEKAKAEVSLSLINIDFPLEDSFDDNSHFQEQEQAITATGLPVLPLTKSSSRAPTIVRDSKSMSLHVEAPKLRAEKLVQEVSQRRGEQSSVDAFEQDDAVGLTAFSFSDYSESDSRIQGEKEVTQTNFSDMPTESRDASLHSSSASTPQIALATAPKKPRAMQVSIEGKPASVDSKSEMPATQPHDSPTTSSSRVVATSQPQKLRASLAALVNKVEPQHTNEQTSESRGLKYGASIPVRTQDATAIVLDANIVELSIEHPEICQLIQTGNKTISLIGLQNGSTRIALVTRSEAEERLVEIREVMVTSVSTVQKNQRNLAEEISVMVRKLYPTSDVKVLSRDGNLIVQGFTDSESDAKKILAFVRKTSLTPVIDRLLSDKR